MKRIRGIVVGPFAALGLALTVLLFAGLLVDLRNFDRTSGGYEPPYTDYTGEPIDFDAGHETQEGIYGPGHVLSTELDCTTGMVTFHIFNGLEYEWRKVSPRAIVVHQPREACERRGFEPRF